MPKSKKLYNLVFDVESTELHGVGFAYGVVVMEKETGRVVDSDTRIHWETAREDSCEWVQENVLPKLEKTKYILAPAETLESLRTRFYDFYLKWADQADVYRDVIFPVETNFLSAVFADNKEKRQ